MRNGPPRPPGLLTRLLGFWRLGPRRREVEADLEELFDQRAAERGPGYARRRYAADVLSVGRRRPHVTAASKPIWRMPTGIISDVVFALRLFRRQPGIVGMAIAGLALAISVTTAVLTMVNAMAFGETGIDDPDSVLRIEGPPWLYPDYLALRASLPSVTAIATAWGGDRPEFRDRGDADRANLPRISVTPVSGDYFHVLGVRAETGRLLTAADEAPGATPAVVLAYATWQRLLSGDDAAIGQTVWLGSIAHTVVGVAARTFVAPGESGPAAWTSLGARFNGMRERQTARTRAALADLPSQSRLTPPDRERLKSLEAELLNPPPFFDQNRVFVRLRPGVTRARAEAEMAAFVTALLTARGRPPLPGAPVVQLTPVNALSPSELWLIGFVATPALLLVILACANVTTLLLASAAERRREIGTRLALGASRARVARQLLTESLVLGGVGGAAGLLLAAWLVPWLGAILGIAASVEGSPSLIVYLSASVFTVIVASVTGLAPARVGWCGDVTSAAQADRLGSPSATGPNRLRAVLVAVQATASVVLLIASALFLRSLVFVANHDHGADIDRLVNVSLMFPDGTDAARRQQFTEAAVDRIREIPGVANVASAESPPLMNRGNAAGPNMVFRQNVTSATYFSTIGARVLSGRTYTEDESRNGAPVAVITQRLAQKFWEGADPIGSTVDRILGPQNSPYRKRIPAETRIIGVVQETSPTLMTTGVSTIYLPGRTGSSRLLVIRAAAAVDPEALVRPIHVALKALDPDVSRSVDLTTSLYEQDLQGPETYALLGSMVALTALALAIVGLFGLTAFAVAERRHEVSVRLALGASGRQVVGMLLRDSLRPVLAGLACGVGLSFFTDRVLRYLLMGISPRDPIAIVAAVAILLFASAVAAFVPARHAARVDPAEMLKQS